MFPHDHKFLEDIIRNEFDSMNQEWRKEKLIIFRKLWTTIQKMDPKYDPLKYLSPFCAKVDFVMNNFDELKMILKEKITKLEEVHG